MNKFYTLLAALLITATTFAQSPESMSYQAVVRDGSDILVSNTTTPIQISILQGITAVYVETQTPTTNANGLLSIEIGGVEAVVVSGVFSDITWGTDTYFIKTEVDVDYNGSYDVTGTSQLLSVPYALHAKDIDKGIYEYVVSNTSFSFSGGDPNNRPIAQFSNLTKTITLDKESDVLITYNTQTFCPYGIRWIRTYVYIDSSENNIFTKLNYAYNNNGSSIVMSSNSGVVRLSAGTHTIAVNYLSNFDTSGSNGQPPSSLTIKELK